MVTNANRLSKWNILMGKLCKINTRDIVYLSGNKSSQILILVLFFLSNMTCLQYETNFQDLKKYGIMISENLQITSIKQLN